jgi:thioredoxin 1
MMTLTTRTFSDVLANNELVLVDFWAEWCEPCKSFTKVLESVMPKYPDVVFGSVDIEKEKELAQDFNIISVPAIMIVKKQVVVFADSGAMPASAVTELIEKAKALDVSQQVDK